MTRAELIAALESAQGPSRELDAEIAKHTAMPEDVRPVFDAYPEIAPHYTASIDAALPNENIVQVFCRATDLGDDRCWVAVHMDDGGDLHDGIARTEALARRLAALRAEG